MIKLDENDKFILKYSYNENSRKFDVFEFEKKKLNETEISILNNACKLSKTLKVHEMYEHLLIKIENNMRNFNSISYDGVILTENISQELKFFRSYFRNFLYQFVKDDIKKKINFQYKKPNADWFFLNENQKKLEINKEVIKFLNERKINAVINILRMENKSDIYIEINGDVDSNKKGEICLDLEMYLKKIEETLTVYFEWKTDRNKLRRLKL